MQYFLVTANKGSITASARALDVAQPAISLQIANLEHELKVKLFERDFRGVQLTESGQKFKQHAELIMQQISLAKQDISGNKETIKGKVTLAVDQAIGNILSVDLFQELEHRFPEIDLQLRIGPSHTIEQWMSEKTTDIGITFERHNGHYLSNSIALIKEDLYLVMAQVPKNPIHAELAHYASLPVEELQHYELFMSETEDSLSQILQREAQQLNFTLKRKNAFGQLMTTLHYVSQGFGLVVLPSSAVFHLIDSNQIRCLPLIQPQLQREVCISATNGKYNVAAANAVTELIREICANKYMAQQWRGELLDQKYYRADLKQINAIGSPGAC
nr:LysR family transcriptional regulator [Neptunicella marina]